jgi:MoaA/NifB/PqqE/SkfB family radical SAM enzyme
MNYWRLITYLAKEPRTITYLASATKIINYLKYKNDLRNRKITTSSFPFYITFQPSAYCNTNCQLCPVGLGIKGPQRGFLEFNTFKKVIDETKNYLIKVEFADWGEPFLNQSIFDMIKYCEEKRIRTYASTNFHYFKNEEDLKLLINCGLSALTISLHGVSQETYAAYQPGKNFEETVEKIKTLINLKKKMKKRKPVIKLAFAITKKNQHEIKKMQQFAKKLGVQTMIYTASLNLRFYIDNTNTVVEKVKEWAQNENLELCNNILFGKKFINELFAAILKEKQISLDKLDKLKLTSRHYCIDPWSSLTVNWDGTVSLCCVDYNKYVMGDTRRESILKIWNNEKYRAVRKYLTGKLSDIDFMCKHCIRY